MGLLLPTTVAAGNQAASLSFHTVATGPWVVQFEQLALGSCLRHCLGDTDNSFWVCPCVFSGVIDRNSNDIRYSLLRVSSLLA